MATKTSNERRQLTAFDLELDTIDPALLGVENNILRVLVERVEQVARERRQAADSAGPASPPKGS